MFEVKDLHVEIEGKKILCGLNLSIAPGSVHAIMGPNGAGKSTLAKVIAGDPSYTVTQGEILFEGNSLLDLEIEERSHAGIFVSFQYPVEIPGICNRDFLKSAFNAQRRARGEETLSDEAFAAHLSEITTHLAFKDSFLERDLNSGLSGGEKKRNEILQMALLNPRFALLDETDSGLDIDALKSVAEGVNELRSKEKSLLLITHYERLLHYIRPDVVHVLHEGKIVQSGGYELAHTLEKEGYAHVGV